MFLPCSINNSIICLFCLCQATLNSVVSKYPSSFIFAPLFINNFIFFPSSFLSHVIINGVIPSFPIAFKIAPCSIKDFTMFSLPLMQAGIRGVSPLGCT